jgi:hypothetical protein
VNTHKLKLYFEEGSIAVGLVCLDHCEPVTSCGECGRHVQDEGAEGCEICEGNPLYEPCFLAQWVEATDPAEVLEWLAGEITIEVNGIFEGDVPTIEVYEPERALAQLTFPA